jgi:WD40 repeat protein
VDGDSFIAMDFSPDAKMAAAGGVGRKITIWETKSGKVLTTLENLEGQISSLAFSADGTEIAAGFYSNDVMIWKAEKP